MPSPLSRAESFEAGNTAAPTLSTGFHDRFVKAFEQPVAHIKWM